VTVHTTFLDQTVEFNFDHALFFALQRHASQAKAGSFHFSRLQRQRYERRLYMATNRIW